MDSLMIMAGLYHGDELVNIVTWHNIVENDGQKKARPAGAGVTLTRDAWMRRIRDEGTPQSKAGAWLRMNPMLDDFPKNRRGFSDDDVAACRFLLLEADVLPLELQLSFLAKLRLPIAMILSSGGKSLHAWVKVDAKDGGEYRRITKQVLDRLKSYGFDPSNSNPSRLSRLPGAQRDIGAIGDGAQRLLYLNPDPAEGRSIL